MRYVYLVEDDVLVSPDFFSWHEAVAEAEQEAACSIAYRCSRNSEARTDITDPGAYFTTARDYASIGVRWSKERLKTLLEHAKSEYYANQASYLFGVNSPITDSENASPNKTALSCDFWTRRNGPLCWPYVPRCYHMGWYGYHRPRGKRPSGFLEDKINGIKRVLRDSKTLEHMAPDFGDIEPLPKEWPGPFEKLVKLQEFK